MSDSRTRLLGVVALIGLIAAGCAGGAELDTLEPQSDNAREIDTLLDRVLAIAGVIGLLVLGAVVFMAVKQRVKTYDGDDEFPEQISHNNTLEIGWTIVPAIIMVVVAVLTTVVHFSINETEANAYEVEVAGDSTSWEPKIVVVGQQWWWEFRYYFTEDVDADFLGDPRALPPADIVTAGQMIIPTGQEIELLVTSRDVIHSFWIPALNGKRDARPGFFAPWEISADDPGVYFGQCTEFCGLSHSRMRMQTIAMDDADFQVWIDEQMVPQTTPAENADDPVSRGASAFIANCSSCHLVEGVSGDEEVVASVVSQAAPNLTHFASRTTFAGGILNTYTEDGEWNRDDLSLWLREPEAVKDNYANGLADGELPRGMPNLGLSERTISDLVAYLETLGPRPSDEIIAATEVE
ncbi:MAG: cytochrome c oxidase subunit II [Actinomycetota bacterium]